MDHGLSIRAQRLLRPFIQCSLILLQWYWRELLKHHRAIYFPRGTEQSGHRLAEYLLLCMTVSIEPWRSGMCSVNPLHFSVDYPEWSHCASTYGVLKADEYFLQL
jgi:hypothetical protein